MRMFIRIKTGYMKELFYKRGYGRRGDNVLYYTYTYHNQLRPCTSHYVKDHRLPELNVRLLDGGIYVC